MATLESLHALLEQAGNTLDSAAKEIRDIPLEPRIDNIRAIADLLGGIFDLQRQIYQQRPELIPTFLWDLGEDGNPSAELVVRGARRRAENAERVGDVATAISLLQFLLRRQPTGDHVESVASEIARLEKVRNGS